MSFANEVAGGRKAKFEKKLKRQIMKTKVAEKKNIGKMDEKGSALVLTMVVLINALLLVAAITAITAAQRRTGTLVKNSTPAFQLADSGIEYFLQKKKTSNSSTKVKDICGELTKEGRANCSGDKKIDLGAETVYLYFLKGDGTVITTEDTLLSDVVFVRSIGIYGQAGEQVSRSLQVKIETEPAP